MDASLDWNFIAVLIILTLGLFGLYIYGYKVEVQRCKRVDREQCIQDIINRLDWLERQRVLDLKERKATESKEVK